MCTQASVQTPTASGHADVIHDAEADGSESSVENVTVKLENENTLLRSALQQANKRLGGEFVDISSDIESDDSIICPVYNTLSPERDLTFAKSYFFTYNVSTNSYFLLEIKYIPI